MSNHDQSRPLTLLIVDDSTMMRTLVKRAAGLSGVPIARCFEAGNGQEALTILETEAIDALLTDINMPVMNGMELLQCVATGERWQHMARLVISADGSHARRAEARRLGVRSYVNKPIRPEAIRDVLSDLVAVSA